MALKIEATEAECSIPWSPTVGRNSRRNHSRKSRSFPLSRLRPLVLCSFYSLKPQPRSREGRSQQQGRKSSRTPLPRCHFVKRVCQRQALVSCHMIPVYWA